MGEAVGVTGVSKEQGNFEAIPISISTDDSTPQPFIGTSRTVATPFTVGMYNFPSHLTLCPP